MKILLQNSLFYPNLVGGAEHSTLLLARELSARGHEVDVLCSSGRPDGPTELTGSRVEGIAGTVYAARSAGTLPLVAGDGPVPGIVPKAIHHGRNVYDPTWRRRAAELIAACRSQVLHTNNLVGLTAAVWVAARQAGVPVVHTIRDLHLLCPRTTLQRSDGSVCVDRPLPCRALSWAKLRYTDQVDVVTSPTRFNLDRHLTVGAFSRARHVVVPNACEVLPDTVPDRTAHRRVRAIYLGAMAPYKGVPELLAAFESLLDGPQVDDLELELALAGDGESVPAVQALAARHPGRVHYLGVIRGEAKDRALREADLLVVPSTCLDNFPRVILDAFSYGLPVIGSDRGGIPEVLHDGEDGLVVPPEPAALAEALVTLAGDRPRRLAMGRAGRRRAEGLTVAAQVSRFEAIYTELAGA